jgi:1,4-alpha-glucan branching enzyme
VQRLMRDLNRLYSREPALHRKDCSADGFGWVIGDDYRNSVFAYLRKGEEGADAPLLVVLNMTPVPRERYRIGVPASHPDAPSVWQEILNTDAAVYGGTGLGNGGAVSGEPQSSHGMPHSLVLTLPPLSALILKPTR